MSSSSSGQGGKYPLWRRIPGSTKAAAVLDLLAFFVGFSTQSSSSYNGEVTSCSFVDWGRLLLAVVAAALALDGYWRNSQIYGAHRLGTRVAAVVAAVLVAVAAYHLVAGLGVVGGPCN